MNDLEKKEEYVLSEDGFILFHDVVLSDEEVVKKLNSLNYFRKKYKKEKDKSEQDFYLALEVIDGYKAYKQLKDRGYYE